MKAPVVIPKVVSEPEKKKSRVLESGLKNFFRGNKFRPKE